MTVPEPSPATQLRSSRAVTMVVIGRGAGRPVVVSIQVRVCRYSYRPDVWSPGAAVSRSAVARSRSRVVGVCSGGVLAETTAPGWAAGSAGAVVARVATTTAAVISISETAAP